MTRWIVLLIRAAVWLSLAAIVLAIVVVGCMLMTGIGVTRTGH